MIRSEEVLLKPIKMKASCWNMFSLRIMLFFFFSGVGCLFPFLTKHMIKLRLTSTEINIILIVVPLLAALGPLIVCPVADRFGGGPGSRSLRVLLAVTIFLAAVSYALLMCIPEAQRANFNYPAVKFTCDSQKALVFQQKCIEPTCYQWPENYIGHLVLNDCQYECHTPSEQSALDRIPEEETNTTESHTESQTTTVTNPDYDGSGNAPVEIDLTKSETQDQNQDQDQEGNTGFDDNTERKKRDVIPLSDDIPPHLCSSDETGKNTCYVYTRASRNIIINASLLHGTHTGDDGGRWCQYQLAGNFSCRIPPQISKSNGTQLNCQVICNLPDPYSSEGNIMFQSQCRKMIESSTVTFWSYFVVRSVADMFSMTVLGLLHAAIVIATRETNLGRGDVGRELIWATLGYAIFPMIIGNLMVLDIIPDSYITSFILCLVFCTVSSLILLFSHSMPLSRPEWWSSHARVIPLGGLKKHLSELIAFSFILVLLGAFWNALDHNIPWHISKFGALNSHIGFFVCAGALPAIPFLWNSEKFVYYCGHSNLLIMTFTFYIIRYIVECTNNIWAEIVCDILQFFTLSLTWVTVILYVRQLVPQHLTVTGQGMAVLFYFCFGRCIGAVYVAVVDIYARPDISHLYHMYEIGAVVAAVIAIIYFIVYHCCLKPCCQGTTGTNSKAPTGVTQGPTTNGTYTPLRVFNNGQKGGRKGGQV